MKAIHLCIAAFILVTLSGQCSAALKPGEELIRDPITGNYTAHFWRETAKGGRLVKGAFATATKIEPVVRSKMMLTNNWNVRYAYKLSNGSNAKQPILRWDMFGLPANTAIANSDPVRGSDNAILIEFFETSLNVPNSSWSGSGARIPEELNIGWLYDSWSADTRSVDTTLGIKPGESLGGFGFASTDLPGIWVAKLFGNTKYHHFSFSGESPDSEDTDLADQMDEIEANDFVPRNVAAPLISVPTPFDSAIVLDNLRAHVATWPSKQLTDSTFAAQLDRYLLSAAEAYRHNQPKAGKEHIETLRDMLKRVHKDLEEDDEEHDGKPSEQPNDHYPAAQIFPINRLAARVLDFDLKYVQQRMKVEDKSKR